MLTLGDENAFGGGGAISGGDTMPLLPSLSQSVIQIEKPALPSLTQSFVQTEEPKLVDKSLQWGIPAF